MGNRAVFLDRDGTIARDAHYCRRPEDFYILPTVPEAIRLLNDHHFKVVVVTNQSGIARGYFTKETLAQIHQKMEDELAKYGARVDAIYYCPHHPDDGCECRKPKTALFYKAAKELDIDPNHSYVIGDMQMDIDAGKALGCKTILVTTGPEGGNDVESHPDYIASNLAEATRWVIKSQLKIIAATPCYNTERFIGDVVSRARKYVEQVVVIDDGSHDNTAKAATAAGALVINHRANRGYGESIKSCFEAARANAADILVILDGDGQHNPENLPHVLTPILNGEADLVIGSRFLPPTQPTPLTNVPRYRKFGINVITFLYNFGSKAKVSDAQSGFRAYNRKVIEAFNLNEKGMSVSIEILIKARKKGFVIKEVPISCSYSPSRLNIRAIKHGLGVALSVVRIRFKDSLCRLFGKLYVKD